MNRLRVKSASTAAEYKMCVRDQNNNEDESQESQLKQLLSKPPTIRKRRLGAGAGGRSNSSVAPSRHARRCWPVAQLPDGWARDAETVWETVDYMRLSESGAVVRASSASAHIEPAARAMLVDWLIQVDTHFGLRHDTLFHAVQLVDRFTQAEWVALERYQLVGVCALWLACKLDERYLPDVTELVELTDDSFTVDEAKAMERTLLLAVDWKLSTPEPSFFVRLFADVVQLPKADKELLVHRAFYLLYLLAVDAAAVGTLPSLAAAAAVCLALLTENVSWPRSLVALTGYTEAVLERLVTQLASLLLRSGSSDLKAAFTKFSDGRFGGVAKQTEWSQSEIVFRLAAAFAAASRPR